LEKALENGTVSEAEIDEIVTRILKTRLPYAILPDKMDYDPALKASKEHTELAREVAEKSMVLLKNQNVLPLQDPSGKKIAVIGRIADVENTGDMGSSNVRSPYVVTPFQGIKNYVENAGGEVLFHEGKKMDEAAEIAKSADAVILVVGYTRHDEGEYGGRMEPNKDHHEPPRGFGGDRRDMGLLESDVELIHALKNLCPNTVVTYVGGSAINMEEWKSAVPAILYTWYAGMEGGNALARVLFGEVNPSGKLPFAVPADEGNLPEFDRYAETAEYGYYHGYTLFDKEDIEVAYPFGYGLSYTTFECMPPVIESTQMGKDDTLRVTVGVTNTGDYLGEEVVQMYVGFSNSKVERPVKLLRGFDKVAVLPGDTFTVALELPIKELAWYNPATSSWEIEEMDYELYTGKSSAKEDLKETSFTITSTLF
jgi:beta-glucosidase